MSDSAPVVEQPAEPAPEPAAAPEPVVEAASPEPVVTDPEVEADIDAAAIEVSDSARILDETKIRNAFIGLRNKVKEARKGSPDAARLQSELNRVTQQLNQLAPMAQAYQAIQHAQQQQPQVQPAAPVEDTAGLEEIAKDFDFYKSDGTPDLDRARRVQARTMRQAEQIAQAHVRPYAEQSLKQRASENIQRAKNTKVKDQSVVDPGILDNLVAKIAQQRGGIETLADPVAMQHLFVNAAGQTHLLRLINGQPTPDPAAVAAVVAAVPAAPPVVTERSGGQAPSQQRGLTAMEKRAAKDAGMSEKDYLDVAKGMKW